jgi:hypothetical protein
VVEGLNLCFFGCRIFLADGIKKEKKSLRITRGHHGFDNNNEAKNQPDQSVNRGPTEKRSSFKQIFGEVIALFLLSHCSLYLQFSCLCAVFQPTTEKSF